MEEYSSAHSHHKHEHGFSKLPEETPKHAIRRQSLSSVFRFGSSIVQITAGFTTGNYALVIEGTEEFTDGVSYAAAASETKTEFENKEKRGLVKKARGKMIGAAALASTISSIGVGYDIAADHGTWTKPIENLDFSHNDIRAASLAIALSGVVYYLNRHTRKSSKPADRFIYRDSIRDFYIPTGIILASGISTYAFKIPHIVEYLLEGGSTGYGWYNTNELYKDWSGISLLGKIKQRLGTRAK
jgi:Co/Zn/Cd efflux system component